MHTCRSAHPSLPRRARRIEGVSFSFNGGKDSTVLLHVLRAAVALRSQRLRAEAADGAQPTAPGSPPSGDSAGASPSGAQNGPAAATDGPAAATDGPDAATDGPAAATTNGAFEGSGGAQAPRERQEEGEPRVLSPKF